MLTILLRHSVLAHDLSDCTNEFLGEKKDAEDLVNQGRSDRFYKSEGTSNSELLIY